MATEICVCGHSIGDHTTVTRARDGKFLFHGMCRHWDKCRCGRCKYTPPWPNSVGDWWCDKPKCKVECVPFAIRGNTIEEFCVAFNGVVYHDDDWRDSYGPARFTKVLEQNPFGG
jgi:hypothetical protein